MIFINKIGARKRNNYADDKCNIFLKITFKSASESFASCCRDRKILADKQVGRKVISEIQREKYENEYIIVSC